MTKRTKLIPSIRFIFPKAKRVISDKASWPTVDKARPRAVIIIAFKN